MSMNYDSNETNVIFKIMFSIFQQQISAPFSYATPFPKGSSPGRMQEFQYLIYSFQQHSWNLSQVAAVIRTFYSLKHLIPCDTFHLSFFCGDYNLSCPMWWDVLILFHCSGLLLSDCWKNELFLWRSVCRIPPFPSYCSKVSSSVWDNSLSTQYGSCLLPCTCQPLYIGNLCRSVLRASLKSK